MTARGLPILNYHALDRARSPISTEPAWFAQTIARLIDAGFVGVDLEAWIRSGRPAVERGFAVTFDDGLRSILGGIETLEQSGVPATVCVVTAHVGRDNAWPSQPRSIPIAATLDWSELADLRRRGFTIAAHGETHARLDALDDRAIRRELLGSRDAIEARLGVACRLVAYPYGAVSARVKEEASRWFDAALGTRLAIASSGDDVVELPRIDAYYLRSPRAVERLISGRLDAALAIRRGLRRVRRAAGRLAAIGA
jgi:peptidoglycan/xylan/chitin deacetylase (PgdA/CDA1 family)